MGKKFGKSKGESSSQNLENQKGNNQPNYDVINCTTVSKLFKDEFINFHYFSSDVITTLKDSIVAYYLPAVDSPRTDHFKIWEFPLLNPLLKKHSYVMLPVLETKKETDSSEAAPSSSSYFRHPTLRAFELADSQEEALDPQSRPELVRLSAKGKSLTFRVPIGKPFDSGTYLERPLLVKPTSFSSGLVRSTSFQPITSLLSPPSSLLFAFELFICPDEVWSYPPQLIGNVVEVTLKICESVKSNKGTKTRPLHTLELLLYRADELNGASVSFYHLGDIPDGLTLESKISSRLPLGDTIGRGQGDFEVNSAGLFARKCGHCKGSTYPRTEKPISKHVVKCTEKVLPLTVLKNEAYEKHFSSQFHGNTFFGRLQSTVFSTLFESDENVFIGAGHLTGKRVAAQLAILRHFHNHYQLIREVYAQKAAQYKKGVEAPVVKEASLKAVYLHSKRATVERIYRQWSAAFKELCPFRIAILMGDEDDVHRVKWAHIIMATTADWNVLAVNPANTADVRLYIFDDLHLLSVDEHYEYILTRLRILVKKSCTLPNPLPQPRVIALGRPMSNVGEIADFLYKATVFNFKGFKGQSGKPSDARLVPLEMKVVELAPDEGPELPLSAGTVGTAPAILASLIKIANEDKNYPSRRRKVIESMSALALDQIRAVGEGAYPALVWVPYTEDALLVAFRILFEDKYKKEDSRLKIFSNTKVPDESFEDYKLQSILALGMAYLTEASSQADWIKVERLFTTPKSNLKALVLPQTLLYKWPHRAPKLALVLDPCTTLYTGPGLQLVVDTPIDDLEQMLDGHAGVFGGDRAKAVLICRPTKSKAYCAALGAVHANSSKSSQPHPLLRPLESGVFGGRYSCRLASTTSFFTNLSAEVYHRNVLTMEDLKEYFGGLFLLSRMCWAPVYYISRLETVGLLTKEEIESIRCGLCYIKAFISKAISLTLKSDFIDDDVADRMKAKNFCASEVVLLENPQHSCSLRDLVRDYSREVTPSFVKALIHASDMLLFAEEFSEQMANGREPNNAVTPLGAIALQRTSEQAANVRELNNSVTPLKVLALILTLMDRLLEKDNHFSLEAVRGPLEMAVLREMAKKVAEVFSFQNESGNYAAAEQWAQSLLSRSTEAHEKFKKRFKKSFKENQFKLLYEASSSCLQATFFEQSKAALLILYHLARLPLPEAAPWLKDQQSSLVLKAHSHVLAAADVFKLFGQLRFTLAAMELGAGLVRAVLPLGRSEDTNEVTVGPLTSPSIRQMSSLITDNVLSELAKKGVFTLRSLRAMRSSPSYAIITIAGSDDFDVSQGLGSSQDAEGFALFHELESFMNATPEPRLSFRQLASETGLDKKSRKPLVKTKVIIELKFISSSQVNACRFISMGKFFQREDIWKEMMVNNVQPDKDLKLDVIFATTFQKPVAEKWWLFVSRPYSGRIITSVAFPGDVTPGVSRAVLLDVEAPARHDHFTYCVFLKNTVTLGQDLSAKIHFDTTPTSIQLRQTDTD